MASFTTPCGQCGANVKVPVEAIGKKARCPKCQQVFAVLPPQAIPVASQTLPLTPMPPQQSCPSCQKHLTPEAKICLECGFDLRTGQKLQTVVEKRKKRSKKHPDNAKHSLSESPLVQEWKRKAIFGVYVAGGGMLLLILLFGMWKYRVATSLDTRLKQLASTNSAQVETAQKALEEAGKKALPQLVEGIKGDSEQARTHCLALLKTLGREGEPALNEFQKGLDNNNNSVRSACIAAIGYLGEKGRSVEARILDFLEDADAGVRTAAFEALTTISTADQVVPRLRQLLKKDNRELQREAVLQLGKLGPAAKVAVPELLTCLDGAGGKDASDWKASVCRSLGQIRDRDEIVLRKLSEVLEDANNSVETRGTAALALGNIGGLRAAELLSKVLLSTHDASIVKDTAAALALTGPEAKVAKILDGLKSADALTERYKKAELEDAAKRENAKESQFMVTVKDNRGRTEAQWSSHYRPSIDPRNGIRSPSGRKYVQDAWTRIFVVQVSDGPSQTALKASQDQIEKKWQEVRQAIDAAIAKIQG